MGTLSVDKILKTSTGAAEFTLPATDGSSGQAWVSDGSGQLSVGEVTAAGIAADAVTLAKMAGITRGSIIVGDASGDPSALTVGTATHVLTSDGTDLSWAGAASGTLPSQTNNSGKTLFTDGSSASWEPKPGRNYIRNGQFDVWQRGTTITNASNLAMGYSADGWRDEGYAWTGNITRQTFTNGQTTVPDNPTYFLRWIVTANPSGFNALVQRIENYPVNQLSGKTIVVSFWIRSVSGTLADGVIMGYGKSTLDGSGTNNIGAVTTTWQKITYSGTLGTITTTSWTTGLTTNAGTTFSNGVDIANYQVEIGDTPTAFDQKTFGQELLACQRYYCKSFAQGTTPANGNGVVNGAMLGKGVTTDDTEPFMSWQYPSIMRAAPTITLYNHRSGGTAGQWDNHGSASSSNSRVLFANDFCVRIDNSDVEPVH